MIEDIFSQLPRNFTQLIEFILIYVIFRGIFSKWIAKKLVIYIFDPMGRFIKHSLIRTERDVAIWMHYKNKALHKGHNHHDPIKCRDGKCIII